MDHTIAMTNTLLMGLVAVASAWLVINPDVHDGVIMKIGLICVSIGSAAAAALLGTDPPGDPVLIGRAALLGNVGGVIVAIGWYMRATNCVIHMRRRASDWRSRTLRG